MKAVDIEGDMEPVATFKGFKLPNDGKINLLPSMQLPMSRQEAGEWLSKRRESIRPWSTFFSTSRMRQPKSAARLSRRVVQNVEHFQSNYFFCIYRSFYLLLGDVSSPPLRIRNCARRLLLDLHVEHPWEEDDGVWTRIVPRAAVQSCGAVFHAAVLHGGCWGSHVLGSWSVFVPHHAPCLYLRHWRPPSTLWRKLWLDNGRSSVDTPNYEQNHQYQHSFCPTIIIVIYSHKL